MRPNQVFRATGTAGTALSAGLHRRIISDGFTDEPTAHGVGRTMRKFQNGAPGGLERDSPSCLSENRVEAGDSRLDA
ncbi:MAG: hypothetical protein JOY83_04805 [Alphaproteobacteria bacterium]|nr:hypothetical protein [Alphaproteobacteria bacterium]